MEPQDPIRALVSQLSRLPGIGERTALRLVHHLLRHDKEHMRALAAALVTVADRVHECPRCCTLTASSGEEGACALCLDRRRDETLLCVVATIQDQAAIESTGEMRGRYHVLHGTLSPLQGTGPDDLRIQPLLRRLGSEDASVTEVIVATPPSIDGEATALYLGKLLRPTGLKVTRIASGVPVGGELGFSDRLTLTRALSLRQPL